MKYTDTEIFNSIDTLVFSDEQADRLVELFKANDHSCIGAFICQFVKDDIVARRERFTQTLKELFGAIHE